MRMAIPLPYRECSCHLSRVECYVRARTSVVGCHGLCTHTRQSSFLSCLEDVYQATTVFSVVVSYKLVLEVLY